NVGLVLISETSVSNPASDTDALQFATPRHLRRTVTTRRQMCLPTRARSRAKVQLRVSYFPADSFRGAHFRKFHRTVRGVLDPEWRGQRLRIPACEVFAPAALRRLVFFLRASAGPDSPRL